MSPRTKTHKDIRRGKLIESLIWGDFELVVLVRGTRWLGLWVF